MRKPQAQATPEAVRDHLPAAGVPAPVKLKGGTTPLHQATASGDAHTVSAQLDAGADPNTHDANGATPLHIAAKAGQAEVAIMLLAYEAAPQVRDHDGATPLHLAAGRGDVETINALLDAGADPNAHDGEARLALRCAEENNHPEAVDVLRRRMGQAGGQQRAAPTEPAVEGGREGSANDLPTRSEEQEAALRQQTERAQTSPAAEPEEAASPAQEDEGSEPGTETEKPLGVGGWILTIVLMPFVLLFQLGIPQMIIAGVVIGTIAYLVFFKWGVIPLDAFPEPVANVLGFFGFIVAWIVN